MKIFKFILPYILVFFSVNLFSQCTGALSSSLNPSSITPGQSTTLSYNLTNNGSPCISALNIDIYYSTSAFNAPSGSNVSCGSASSSAGKVFSGNDLGEGHFRVIIYGGTTTIGNGTVVNIQFSSKSNAPEGTYPFTCSGEASNPNGDPVTITSCNTSNVLICTLPSCATNPNPSSGATGVSTTPTLSWSSVSGAISYDVYFGTSSNPSLATNVSNTQYSPGNLKSNTTYYWKIIPKNTCGSASGCPVWNFTSTSSGGTYPYTYLWNFGDG